MADLNTSIADDVAYMQEQIGICGALQGNVRHGLDRWRNSLGGVINNGADAAICFTGTSLMNGAKPASPNQYRPNSPAVRVARDLKRAGIRANAENFIGNGSAINNSIFDVYDSRVTRGAWASHNIGVPSVGGYPARVSAAGTLSFAFVGKFNLVDIFEVQTNAFAGRYSADIDGSITVTAGHDTLVAAPATVLKRMFSFTETTDAAHTLNINWVSGSPAIFGASFYYSTEKSVRCINLAMGDNTAARWALKDPANYYGPSFVVPGIIAPNLVVDECGTNDWVGGVSVAAYTASTTTKLTAFKTVSDVIGMTPYPTAAATIARSVQQQYVDAYIGVCQSLGIPWIDEWRACVPWEAEQAAGQTADSYHPNQLGTRRKPNLISRAILSI